jgi:polyhydroxyalkanoate synthase subunit PhaC
VDLGRISCPVLNIIAEHDNIAPPAMSEPLLGLLEGSEDRELMRFPVGHIGLSASSKAPVKVWPRVATWVEQRSRPLEGA